MAGGPQFRQTSCELLAHQSPLTRRALQVNAARQQERVRLFEIGLCFCPEGQSGPATSVRQVTLAAGVLSGPRSLEVWNQARDDVDFFDVKGLVEQLFEWAGLPGCAFEALDDPIMHPGQAAAVLLDGRRVGRLGRLHPEVESRLDVSRPIYVFELEADAVLRRGLRKYRGISRYPSVRRDLALVVDRRVAAADIGRIVRETLGNILVDFRLFDVYQGKGIDSNEKSLAVGLTLQDASATLTEDQIAGYTQDVVSALQREVSARLR